ncbi:MAG: dihydroorotate dehydrogenase electron transfer subunit [Gammaproteobacteria bacterium]|nr:dihydroorotate dehydrogenase electron transfer subunit [Gammaproteobacteria bacterium]
MINSPSIYAENARVLEHETLPEGQYLLRLHTPECAKTVQPGNFIHLSCSREKYSLKRPFSVLRSSKDEGWIEILYKVVGSGTEQLSKIKPEDNLHCMGPIGNTFAVSKDTKQPLLLGGGVGIPPILFFAEQLKKNHITPMVIMGSEIPFPFKVQPSKILIDSLPSEAIASMTLLEDLSIPSRLTSKQNYPGCFEGYIHELALIWLQGLSEQEREGIEIFACGPSVMLEAVAKLSQQFSLPCQLSLEEFMACAVGGCAGCTVEITNDAGQRQMKRVCVDGPIFDANAVYPL